MKRTLSLFLGLALILGTASTTFAQNSKSGHKHGKGGHKRTGTRSGPSR